MSTLPTLHTKDPTRFSLPLADGLEVSRLALGCMHFGGSWESGSEIAPSARDAARSALATALELGWNFFDHADIYGRGRSEIVFGELLGELGVDRASIILQSKCGICLPVDPPPGLPRWYDFSREHILRSVEGILQRLQTDYLDILILHRPDFLLDPDEILEAFDQLRRSGSVRHFGVSNFTPPLLDLFREAGFLPAAHQVELSLLKNSLLGANLVAEGGQPLAGHTADGTLEWHRRHGVLTQAWAPLAYGYLSGRAHEGTDARLDRAARAVGEMAQAHGVPPEAIVIGWLLRHPAGIQPVIGSRQPERLRACHQALSLTLDRQEWYRLFMAAREESIP